MLKVTKDNPCLVCGRPDGCLFSEDGTAALCSRIESDKLCGEPFAGGWLHILIDRPPQQRRKYVKPPAPGPAINFVRLANEFHYSLTKDGLERAAGMFGVRMDSLNELDLGWNSAKRAHSFPMKDGKGNIIGIRLRTLDGQQFCVSGSKNGLFWPTSVKADSKELLFIAEGPSDTAALLDLRFSPIGRASCGTGFQYIKEMIEHYDRQVVIFADKDKVHFTPDGRKYFPGYDGGLKLAQDMKPFVRSVRLIKPPRKKDIRAWYLAGATRTAVLALVKNAKFI